VARLSRHELERIVARDLSGYRLAEPPPSAAADIQPETMLPPEDNTPDLETLHRKYRASQAAAARPPEVSADIDAEAQVEDAIVTVVPETTADPSSRAAGPKTVVISGKEKRVIGTQG
jgi:hypothetical protein